MKVTLTHTPGAQFCFSLWNQTLSNLLHLLNDLREIASHI